MKTPAPCEPCEYGKYQIDDGEGDDRQQDDQAGEGGGVAAEAAGRIHPQAAPLGGFGHALGQALGGGRTPLVNWRHSMREGLKTPVGMARIDTRVWVVSEAEPVRLDPTAFDPEAFRREGRRVVDILADFLAGQIKGRIIRTLQD